MKPPKRPAMKKAASVGSLIEELLSRRQMDGKLREYRVWQIWDETMGPQIAARARPVRIREGVLEVRVDQPVWMQQLQLLKPKLLVRLNERLEGSPIKDLYLRRGRIPDPPSEREPLSRRPDPPLSPEDGRKIEQMVAPLEDAELKERLRSLLARQFRLQRGRKEEKG